MGFLWYIIIGIVAGFLAGKIMRGGGFGVIINLILGIVGGVLGGWVFGLFGLLRCLISREMWINCNRAY